MTAVVAGRVHRSFGAVTAVSDVSLAVRAGQVVGLVGANGAGKTTLIRILLGLLPPDRGSVTLAGGPPSRTTRERVGYVPQSLGLWTDLTLREHLRLARDVYGRGRTTVDDDHLARAADRPIGTLPLGLRRRAAFVVALAHDPAVLILDEPTSGVDPLARSRLWESIHRTAEAGAAVLVSTHYLDEASRCDRVVLLAEGRVVADGTVAELTAGRVAVAVSAPRWQLAWQRLREAGLDVLPAARALRVAGADEDRIRRALDGLEARITTVPATLDEVFLQVTAR